MKYEVIIRCDNTNNFTPGNQKKQEMKFDLLLKLFTVTLLSVFVQALFAQNIIVENNSPVTVKNILAEISTDALQLPLGIYEVISEAGEALPLEVVEDIHGIQKAVFPIDKIDGNTVKTFTVRKGNAESYPKRTYAELSHKIGGEFEGNKYEGGYSWVKPNRITVDGDFRDHAYYIKYEGPGWESDMAGFRFYLDQRNGVDVYGKKTPGISLPAVGVDGYDNYHNMADWGMDILKVARALGLGSIASWDGEKAIRVEKRDSATCYIPADGKVRSQVMTTFYGWETNNDKFNLKSLITIDAGNRASHMALKADKDIDNLTTGIIKDKNADLILPQENNKSNWSYIATFGKQSLNSDMMGLAVFYRTDQLKEITEDDLNHIVVLKPKDGFAEYYFMPTWEQDWNPVKTKDDFMECINEMLDKLNNPIVVEIK